MRLLHFEKRWLLAIWGAIIPGGVDPRLPRGAGEAPMDRFVDEFFGSAPLGPCLGLRLGLWIFIFAAIFWRLKLRPFPRLRPEDQTRYLDAMASSRVYLVRELPGLFKLVACLGYCGLHEVQRAIGVTRVYAEPPDWAR